MAGNKKATAQVARDFLLRIWASFRAGSSSLGFSQRRRMPPTNTVSEFAVSATFLWKSFGIFLKIPVKRFRQAGSLRDFWARTLQLAEKKG
jgi:hypothetical protein